MARPVQTLPPSPCLRLKKTTLSLDFEHDRWFSGVGAYSGGPVLPAVCEGDPQGQPGPARGAVGNTEEVTDWGFRESSVEEGTLELGLEG